MTSVHVAVGTMFGGAVLSPLLKTLIDELTSMDLSKNLTKIFNEGKMNDELKEWKRTLNTIYLVLDNAEEQQMTNQFVKSWLDDITNVAYDVDDVLDGFKTGAMQSKFHGESSTLFSSVVAGINSVKSNASILSKMKKISEKLDNIMKRKDLLNLREGQVRHQRATLPTSSILVNKAHVYGREEDHKNILELMNNEAPEGEISVIPIVGMGGVGKTTLAQLVYNDDSVPFDFKAWVSVGEDFDVLTITKTILRQLGEEKIQREANLNFLQLKLQAKLSGKRFLIVLDDMWSKNYDKWTLLSCPFAAGDATSRIIITTRNEDVSFTTSLGTGYRLNNLSDEHCLSILARHALKREDFSEHLALKEVGDKIVKRCDGLPLAAKALGGLLRCVNHEEWEQVLQNNLWEEKGILPSLRISYRYLPSDLKRCFGYCAIFPKKYEFRRDELVQLWLAEGFIQQLSQGYGFFDELFARSLFQLFGNDASIFVMHNFVNDLARSVSGVFFNLDEEMESQKSTEEVRHSAFNRGKFDIARRFEDFHKMKTLRTILALPIIKERKSWDHFYISGKVLCDLIPKLKYLRTLSLSGYRRVELPESINHLQHLRHLNLSCTEIETLPESLSELFNLQMLILRNCSKLHNLPEKFCNLISLLCLDIRGTDKLEKMPLHFGNLKELRILTKFIVGRTDGCRITEMLKIPNLQGQLQITELQNVINAEDVDCLRMKEREKFEELALEWTNNFDGPRDKEKELQVLQAFEPTKSIARISIVSFGGTEFSSWLSDHSFNNMTFMQICNCRNVSSLPPLRGLPLLKELSIKGMPRIQRVFYGEVSSSSANVFQSLETLNFDDMEEWEQWICFNGVEEEGSTFPKLKKLGIRSCPKLIGDFPKSLPSLEELIIENCKEAILKPMPNLKSIIKLTIRKIAGDVCFDGAFPEVLKSLKELVVDWCGVKHLWENGTKIERLTSLKLLRIQFCQQLVSLVEGEEENFPPNLQVLDILECEELKKLPRQLHSLTSLVDLKVRGCSELVRFPTGGLPDNVKSVEIQDCYSLKKLPEGVIFDVNGNSCNQQACRIEELGIITTASLQIPSNGVFPASLRSLEIWNGMEAQLLWSMQIQKHFSQLTSLDIRCSKLETFPDMGLPIPTLSSFKLYECENLRSLPCNMHDLTSLKTVHLSYCSKIESFPERGLPLNITYLVILYCGPLNSQPLSNWRLERLTRLQSLTIHGGMEKISSFPDDSLPNSLTGFFIYDFKKLKSISGKIQRLASLEWAMIVSCPNLQSLPKDGFPASLGSLDIYNCPLLEMRRKEGDYWPLIAGIPKFAANPAEF